MRGRHTHGDMGTGGEKERRGMRAHRRSKTIPSTGRRRHCSAPAGAAVSAFIDVYTAVACQQGGRSQSEVAVDVLLSQSVSTLQPCAPHCNSTVYRYRLLCHNHLPVRQFFFFFSSSSSSSRHLQTTKIGTHPSLCFISITSL